MVSKTSTLAQALVLIVSVLGAGYAAAGIPAGPEAPTLPEVPTPPETGTPPNPAPWYVQVLVDHAQAQVAAAQAHADGAGAGAVAAAEADLVAALAFVDAAQALAGQGPADPEGSVGAGLAAAGAALQAILADVPPGTGSTEAFVAERLAAAEVGLLLAEQGARLAARDALLAGPATVWTSLNMGTGSGLDADLLDGYTASDFLGLDSDLQAQVNAEAAARQSADAVLAARALALEGFVNGGHFQGKSFTNTGTSPEDIEVLAVRNLAYGPMVELRNTGQNGKSWLWQSGAGPGKEGTLRLHERSNQITPFVVSATGRVGINTEAPSEQLTVAGTARVTGAFQAGNTAVSSLLSTGPANVGSLTSTGAASVGSLTSTGAASVGSLTSTGAASVGSLTASGAATVGGLTSNGNIRATSNGDFGPYLHLQNTHPNGRSWLWQAGMGPSQEGTLRLLLDGTSMHPIAVNAQGNVGINNVSPTGANLDVGGTLRATGAASVGSLTTAGSASVGSLSTSGAANVGSLTATGAASVGSLSTSGPANVGSLTATGAASVGSLQTSGSVSAGGVTVSGSGPFGPTVEMKNTGPGGRAWLWQSGLGPGREGHLRLNDATAGSTPLVVDPNGRVGVNVFDPTSTLHVGGGANVTQTLEAGKVRTQFYDMPGEIVRGEQANSTSTVILVENDTSATLERNVTIGHPSSTPGRVIMVKNLDDTNQLKVRVDAFDHRIEGSNSYTIGVRGGAVLYSDGSHWWVMAKL